jgi:hypothetical protein
MQSLPAPSSQRRSPTAVGSALSAALGEWSLDRTLHAQSDTLNPPHQPACAPQLDPGTMDGWTVAHTVSNTHPIPIRGSTAGGRGHGCGWCGWHAWHLGGHKRTCTRGAILSPTRRREGCACCEGVRGNSVQSTRASRRALERSVTSLLTANLTCCVGHRCGIALIGTPHVS